MDCDNQEIEATKTIGSTDVEKVLKKLKNKNTKESIILLDYIGKLEKENKELKKANKKLQADIEIKDKVIDLILSEFAEIVKSCPADIYEDDYKIDCENQECNEKECFKQYFYEQVEKVGGEDE